MRLVIDLEAAQASNRERGIGRYALALAEALLLEAGDRGVWIALNDAFPDTIEPLRARFDTLLPQDRIVVWKGLRPAAGNDPTNDWRRGAGEILREAFLATIEPDIVYVPSLFEGIVDDAVTSIGAVPGIAAAGAPTTAVAIHDLIPLVRPDLYLTDPAVEAAYQRKIMSLRRAGLWLPVSDWTRREAIALLDVPPEKTLVVSNAADSRFRPMPRLGCEAARVRSRFGLTRPFVMYTGGMDPRKNIDRLVSAFARLPDPIRRTHQLAIVCSADAEGANALRRHAVHAGLSPDELVLTGFVSDDDLVILYNLCQAFCVPSLLEGFCLPALEAMQCGAPTIGANATSIPEVIGNRDALFDPESEADIASKLQRVLSDETWRRRLAAHGLEQARKFNWQQSACRAWQAFESERRPPGRRPHMERVPDMAHRLRLAYVSPLPPDRSGIAEYSAELLPELARDYDIDVIVPDPQTSEPRVSANCETRDPTWFDRNAERYDRVLYHFGNSTYHRHMFDLIRRHPGVVVLHDFYLSSIIAHMDLHEGVTGYFARSLYHAHGYGACREYLCAADPSDSIWKYPANLAVLETALGVIVHSEFSRALGAHQYGAPFVAKWVVIPQLRRAPGELSRAAARAALGMAEHDFIVCSFGVMGPAKLSHRLLEAWLGSALAQAPDCHLVFVGEDPSNRYAGQLRRMMAGAPAADRVHLTGFTSGELYRHYLAAADVAVQLRTLSRGETSRAVLDCMAHSVPTIVNAHGALAELPRSSVVMLPDAFTDDGLIAAITMLRREPQRRAELGATARATVLEHHAPRLVADRFHEAIERFSTEGREAVRAAALTGIAALDPAPATAGAWLLAARAIHGTIPPRRPERQLLVDVSELVQRDIGTGIQRMVKCILGELFAHPPAGFRVEAVYATERAPGYRYARAFSLQFLGCPEAPLVDAPVDVRPGDIFVGLDLQPHVVARQVESYAEMRRIGAEIYFLVPDVLPLLMPQFFSPGAAEIHARWLSIVASCADGLICISRAVADEVIQWLDMAADPRLRPLRIGWNHLGADIAPPGSRASSAHPLALALSPDLRARLADAPGFLMVGTIEPRKGHAQVLDAFERLWASGVSANLVIVGRQGWMVEELVGRMRANLRRHRRLVWLERISDEELETLYASSACLLVASEGEGFGLPLIEAARHGLPVLARDVPVFREVASAHARYFRAATGEELARAIRGWLAAFAAGTHERSDRMPWLTWAESNEHLKGLLLGKGWYAKWPATTKPIFGLADQPAAATLVCRL
ncbi:MAG: glycosyltransferase [Acetobacteraceae bacterium]